MSEGTSRTEAKPAKGASRNECYDIHLIDTVKTLADRHGCRLAEVHPENRIIRLEAISRLSFRLISMSGPRFQSSKYGHMPVADPGATGAADNADPP